MMGTTASATLHEKLLSARIAQGEHIAALRSIRDAAMLRLQALKDELEPIVRSSPSARDFVDLSLVPGNPPRLWIDMVSYVLMEPDPATYRFQRDVFDEQELLFESQSRSEIADAITNSIAHRMIERERHFATAAPVQFNQVTTGYDTASLMLAWLSGISIGVCAVLLAASLLRAA